MAFGVDCIADLNRIRASRMVAFPLTSPAECVSGRRRSDRGCFSGWRRRANHPHDSRAG
jgi:hypothetical protein